MNQTFRVEGVTKTGTLATIGLFADTTNDFSIAVAEAAGETEPEFSDKYFFYMQFTPDFDITKTHDMTINVSFQKGDERSMWDTASFTYFDDSAGARQFWSGPNGDITSKVYTNSEFLKVDTDVTTSDSSSFSGLVNYDPYYMQIWKEILPEDTLDADGNEIVDGSVYRF